MRINENLASCPYYKKIPCNIQLFVSRTLSQKALVSFGQIVKLKADLGVIIFIFLDY